MFLSLILLFNTVSSLTAPEWPTFWSANWDFVEENNPSKVLERGLWYYNVTVTPGLLRQDNDINCPIAAFKKQCRTIFKGGDIYLYNPDLNDLCCKCWNDVNPTPPNWLVGSKADGPTYYAPLNANCTKWTYEVSHFYYACSNNSYPVAEAGGGTTLQWWNIKVASNAFDSSVFYLPAGCTKGCNQLFGEKVQVPPAVAKNIGKFHCGL
eukprot:UN07700